MILSRDVLHGRIDEDYLDRMLPEVQWWSDAQFYRYFDSEGNLWYLKVKKKCCIKSASSIKTFFCMEYKDIFSFTVRREPAKIAALLRLNVAEEQMGSFSPKLSTSTSVISPKQVALAAIINQVLSLGVMSRHKKYQVSTTQIHLVPELELTAVANREPHAEHSDERANGKDHDGPCACLTEDDRVKQCSDCTAAGSRADERSTREKDMLCSAKTDMMARTETALDLMKIWRFCLDYRLLNSTTTLIEWSLTNIKDFLQ